MFCAARPASNAVGPLRADDDRHHERRAAHVVARVDARGDLLAHALVAHDDEAPRLAVLRRSRDPAGLEDPPLGLRLDRARRVLAHLALAHDGQVGVHDRETTPRPARAPRTHTRGRSSMRSIQAASRGMVVAELLVAVEHAVKELVVGRIAPQRVLQERIRGAVRGRELVAEQVRARRRASARRRPARPPSRRPAPRSARRPAAPPRSRPRSRSARPSRRR